MMVEDLWNVDFLPGLLSDPGDVSSKLQFVGVLRQILTNLSPIERLHYYRHQLWQSMWSRSQSRLWGYSEDAYVNFGIRQSHKRSDHYIYPCLQRI